MERLDPPGPHLVHVHVEGGLVELEHVEPERGELARLLVDDPRELHREASPVAIVLVGQRVHDRHRPGHRELELLRRVGSREGHLVGVDGPPTRERPGHRGHLGLVAIGADADRHAPGEVDAVDRLEEAVDEVLARLLAVAHDVDTGRLLLAERHQHRVALALGERRTRQVPRRPQHAGLREPRRFGKAIVVRSMPRF